MTDKPAATKFDVFAVNIKSGERRDMARGLSVANAEAYIAMAVMRRGVEEEFFISLPSWQPISTALCDDRWAFVRWSDGKEHITDLDHDSDPQWWAERGATHWRDMTDDEKEIHWGKQARRAHDRDVQDGK